MPIVNGKRIEVVLNPYSTINRKIPSVISEIALGNIANEVKGTRLNTHILSSNTILLNLSIYGAFRSQYALEQNNLVYLLFDIRLLFDA